MTPDELESLASNDELLEVARRAIEDQLVDLRDSGISMLRNNGLVIKYRNGNPSDIIRMGSDHAMRIGLKAIAARLRGQ